MCGLYNIPYYLLMLIVCLLLCMLYVLYIMLWKTEVVLIVIKSLSIEYWFQFYRQKSSHSLIWRGKFNAVKLPLSFNLGIDCINNFQHNTTTQPFKQLYRIKNLTTAKPLWLTFFSFYYVDRDWTLRLNVWFKWRNYNFRYLETGSMSEGVFWSLVSSRNSSTT